MSPSESTYLDHVAIAGSDGASLQLQKLFSLLGIPFSDKSEKVLSQGVEARFASVDHRANVELLTPLEEGVGTIAKFIASKGGGIHHLSFRVADVAAMGETLKKAGFTLIYEHPVPGAHNLLVNFIHPKSAGGVLIEIASPQNKEDIL